MAPTWRHRLQLKPGCGAVPLVDLHTNEWTDKRIRQVKEKTHKLTGC